MPFIQAPDADWKASAVAYKQPIFPTLLGDLFALYLFGSEMPLSDETIDYAGYGLTLDRIGEPELNPFSAEVGQGGYYETPFTGNDLLAATKADNSQVGQASIVAITKVLTTQGNMAASAGYDNTTTAPDHISLGTEMGNNTVRAAAAFSKTAPGNSNISSACTPGSGDMHRGSAPEMIAGVWGAAGGPNYSVQSYRRYTGRAQQAGPLQVVTGAHDAPWTFFLGACRGSDVVANFTGGAELTALAFYRRALTAAELETIFVQVQAWLATQGFVI